mgnify:CR=1 FL=1
MKLKNILLGMIISVNLVPVIANAQSYDKCDKENTNDCYQNSHRGHFSWFPWSRSSETTADHHLSTSTPVDESFGHSEGYSSGHASVGESAGFGGHASAHGGSAGE